MNESKNIISRLIKKSKSDQSDHVAKPIEIDLDSVPYYPLPPSPATWDQEKIQPSSAQDELFELSENSNCKFREVNKIDMEQRPDPAYRYFELTSTGCLFIDKKGRSKLFPKSQASLLKRASTGGIVNCVALNYDIYRVGTNPFGDHSIFLSSDGLIHVYDKNLTLLLLHDLSNDSLLRMIRDSNIDMWGPLRTQIRCVSISPSGKRLLFTLADTAWCVSDEFVTSWVVCLPLNDGWERVYTRNNLAGNRSDIESALQYMGLKLPVTQQEIKSQYRGLALQWHPDINKENPRSTERMQKLNNAFSILTGINPENLEITDIEVVDYRRTKPDLAFNVAGIEFGISISGSPPLDWIYAAAFGSDDQHAYLGSYSGKILKVDFQGKPKFVIDVGNTPRKIIEIDNFLYIMTDTRLYVIGPNLELIEIIDIFMQGKLMVTHFGFNLIAGKNLKCYSRKGDLIDEIRTKHPIRAVYNSGKDLCVETRQHRAVISCGDA